MQSDTDTHPVHQTGGFPKALGLGKSVNMTRAEFAALDDKVRRDLKRTKAVVLALFDGKGRGTDNVTQVTGATFDLDNHAPQHEQLMALLKNFGNMALFHESSSSTPDSPRWRVFIPYRDPVTVAEHQAAWEQLATVFPKAWLGKVRIGRDPARLNYCPLRFKDEPKGTQLYFIEGPAFDASNQGGAVIDLEEHRQEFDSIAAAEEHVASGEGGFWRALTSISQRMANRGATVEEIIEKLEAVIATSPRTDGTPQDYLKQLPRLVKSADEKRSKPARELIDARREFQPVEEPHVANATHGLIDLEALDALPVESPRFIVKNWIPEGSCTLFAADGGSGKSYITLDVGVRLALGREVFGFEPQAGTVLFLSAEDNAQVLHWRLSKLAAVQGISIRDLKGKLHIQDATLFDNTLAIEPQFRDARGTLCWLERWDQVEALVRKLRPKTLLLDNVSDFYGANENNRSQVRSFINRLNRLATELGMGVVLLAHVNASVAKGENNGSKNYSGSTGWHNSVRSRWFLADGILTLEKCNYGTRGLQVGVEWDSFNECFRLISSQDAGAMTDERVFELIAAELRRGARIARSCRANNGPGSILRAAKVPKMPEKRLSEIIDRLIEAGRLEAVAVPKRGSNSTETTVQLRLPPA